jgi:transposase, IS30 family
MEVGPVHRLSPQDREEISRGLAAELSFRRIAGRIGRDHSVVSREVGRNGGRARYRAQRAQLATRKRGRRPKARKLVARPVLAGVVEEGLRRRWSPGQIVARLQVEFPHDERMRISHETIYRSLYVQGRGGLRRELAACLRSGHARRQSRYLLTGRSAAGRGQITDMVLISERPAEVEDRAVPGHWEGDLLIGARNQSQIGVLVERSTRFVVLVHLPAGRSAAAVRDAITSEIVKLPGHLRRSLTWDRGKEMAEHAAFTVATGIPVYFCDPKSPWQRGSNENTNGLLRQYYPKRADLSGVTPEHLAAVAAELNGRPRMTLNWQTPAEALNKLLTQQPPAPGALTK